MLIKTSKDSKKTGSEALKFIADVIVSDADKRGNGGFNAIINSIIASKMIYKNLLRFIKYLLTTNVARFCIIGYTIFTKLPLLMPQQILFCGLIIDFFAMIIITFEKPNRKAILLKNTTEELLNIQRYIPYSILTGVLWSVSVILTPILLRYLGYTSISILSTATFVSIILSQLAVLSETIKDESIFKQYTKYNRAHIILAFLVIVSVVILLFVKSIGNLFNVVELSWFQLLVTLIPSIIMIIVGEFQKIFCNTKTTPKTD